MVTGFTSLNFFIFETTFFSSAALDDADLGLSFHVEWGIGAFATFSAMGADISSTPGSVVMLVRLVEVVV